MRITIATPSSVEDPLGNSITALRWADILQKQGHEVTISTEWIGQQADLLIALHARRSNPAIEKFKRAHPDRPIIVALTGTDLYRDLKTDAATQHSLVLASRIVALQDHAAAELDPEACAKLRVIYQSALPPGAPTRPLDDCFEICVLSHLREVKDPLRAAWAARQLPSSSRIRITHAGRALEPIWTERARDEEQANPRYVWVGERSHEISLALLARSRALVLSSEMEGGANVISEAVACGVPILCSKIPGNIGMLGQNYAGYFALRDTTALCSLLTQIETDKEFFSDLQGSIVSLQDRFRPEREIEAWQTLLEEL